MARGARGARKGKGGVTLLRPHYSALFFSEKLGRVCRVGGSQFSSVSGGEREDACEQE